MLLDEQMFERSECTKNETDGRENDSGRSREVTAEAVSKWCDYCGGPVATDEWYPAATRHDDDGNVEIYGFCDETCREQWESERAGD